MNEKIYIIKDRVAMRYTDIMMGANDGTIVRNAYQWLKKRPDFNDLELYCTGELDITTGKIKAYDVPKQVSWDAYKFPETEAKQIRPEEMAKEAING